VDAQSFAHCVQRDDISSLTALPGVGKKTAERLLIEMRDKLKEWLVRAQDEQGEESRGAFLAPFTDIVADAEGALITLGYKPQEASRMVAAVNDDSVVSSEELIRRALKSMVKV
jgi:holliday junction DNA helicase RuvA